MHKNRNTTTKKKKEHQKSKHSFQNKNKNDYYNVYILQVKQYVIYHKTISEHPLIMQII